MPFGCVPIRQGPLPKGRFFEASKSPMPFGCVPIRQLQGPSQGGGRNPVSNAFRLCAYPAAGPRRTATFAPNLKSPMPFGCVPIRQRRCSSTTTPRLPRLQCLSAVCLSGRMLARQLCHCGDSCLQCLSAVCLSGRRFSPIRFVLSGEGLQCLSAVCLSGSGHGKPEPPPFPCLQCLSAVCLSGRNAAGWRNFNISQVSNAFRLCAYPAEEHSRRRVSG